MTISKLSLRGGLHAVIRPATPEDAAEVLAFFEQVAAESDYLPFGAGEYGRNLEQQAEQLRAHQDPAHGVMLGSWIGPELAGLVGIHRLQRPRIRHRAQLGVSVLRKYWAHGLGRALCEAAIVEARRIGLSRIDLHVRADNTRAIALYEALGFVVEGRLRGAFKVGDVDYDDILMALHLHT